MFRNKRNTVITKYKINGFPPNCVSGVKYRDVSISSMPWRDHINDICIKARKSLGLIRMNLRIFPQYVRNQVNASRPILEYACCVWDPCQRRHIKQLESVQHHAARFTTGNYYSMNPECVTNMVTQLGWDQLEHKLGLGCFIKLSTILHHQLKVHNSSTRGSASHRFRQLSPKLNCCKYSFLPATIVHGIPCRLKFVNCRHWKSFNMRYPKSLYNNNNNNNGYF